jgi:hypothetical protein
MAKAARITPGGSECLGYLIGPGSSRLGVLSKSINIIQNEGVFPRPGGQYEQIGCSYSFSLKEFQRAWFSLLTHNPLGHLN